MLNFFKTKQARHICEKALNSFCYLLVLTIEFSVMYRFFFKHNDYLSSDCILNMAIICTANTIIFISLYKASNYDCGRAPKVKVK